MADNNNALLAALPEEPYPELKKLDRLVGRWRLETNYSIEGYVTFEWMIGGFFMIQHIDLVAAGHKIIGVEYIGFDVDTQTLRSHMMSNIGQNFTYTWDIVGDEVWNWLGDKDSDNFSRGTFSDDSNTITGRWQWTLDDGKIGGYAYTMTRE